jgi:hypothetical protein
MCRRKLTVITDDDIIIVAIARTTGLRAFRFCYRLAREAARRRLS